MDNLCLQALVEELRDFLLHKRIRKVQQFDGQEFLFSLRHPCPYDLVVILEQQLPYLFLRPKRTRSVRPVVSSDWLLAVRRYLVGGEIIAIKKELDDRVLTIAIEDSRSPHPETIFHFRLELIPRRVNALLVDSQGQVLRSFRPRRPAIRPTSATGASLGRITKEEFFDLLLKSGAESPSRGHLTAEGHRLQQEIRGLGPLFAREITHRNPTDPEVLWDRLQRLLQRVQEGPYSPRIYGPGEGNRRWICSPFPLETLDGCPYQEYPGMNDALSGLHQQFQGQQRFIERRRYWVSHLRRQRRKKTRLLNGLQNDLEESLQAQQFKRYSDLLLAQASRLPAGRTSVRLPDLFHPEQPEVVIPLEPRLSLLQNATRYARRFRKASRAIPRIQARLETIQAELCALEKHQERLDSAMSVEDLEKPPDSPHPDLAGTTAGEARRRSSREERTQELSRVSRQFVSSEGLTILVGKGNRQNDILTAKIARSEDFWLHVAGYSGSHVVLRNPEKLSAPSSASLMEAAQLAAYFSQARNAPKIEVHYTQSRFVSKPKGGKPGVVRLGRYQSIAVHPCIPDSVEKFSSSEETSPDFSPKVGRIGSRNLVKYS